MIKKVDYSVIISIIAILVSIGIIILYAGTVSAGVHTLEIYFNNTYVNNNNITQIIQLNPGWNLISLGVVPSNKSIDYIIRDIKSKVIVINSFDNGALTYDPQLPDFSDLQEIDQNHGYWIKMNSSANLTVVGTAISNKTINLVNNWNLISYMCSYNKNVTDVFSGIMNKVIVINGFDNGVQTYDPQLPDFSDLQEMKPRYGYWVKLNQTALLNYNC
jgi:hypothetical protein